MTFFELEQKAAVLHPHLDSQGQMLVDLFLPFCKSLRDENAALRAENAALRAENEQLKNRLNLNSNNSSLPPSKELFRSPKQRSLRVSSGKARGGQVNHRGQGGRFREDIDQIITHKLDTLCPDCGTDLSSLPVEELVRKQIVDIPIVKPVVLEYQLEVKTCSGCAKCWKAVGYDVPVSEVQYGSQLQAFALYLSARHMIPVQRTQELLEQMDIKLSTGTLDNIRKRAAKLLGGFHADLKEMLSRSSSVHFDETGTYVNGDNHWVHVASNSHLSYYQIDEKRGGAALENIGILGEFTGVAHHDCYGSYKKYTKALHSLCNAHLLRELNGVVDRKENNDDWATNLKQVLLHAKKLVEQSDKKVLSLSWQTRLKNKIRSWVALGLKHHPAKERPETQKKGKVKQTKTHNLLNRISNYTHRFWV